MGAAATIENSVQMLAIVVQRTCVIEGSPYKGVIYCTLIHTICETPMWSNDNELNKFYRNKKLSWLYLQL